MAKYHINPKTGRPNLCNPEKTGVCAYAKDGENPPHYDSKDEAKVAYEKTGTEKFGATKTIKKAPKPDNSFVITKATQDELEERNDQKARDYDDFIPTKNPVKMIAIKKTPETIFSLTLESKRENGYAYFKDGTRVPLVEVSKKSLDEIEDSVSKLNAFILTGYLSTESKQRLIFNISKNDILSQTGLDLLDSITSKTSHSILDHVNIQRIQSAIQKARNDKMNNYPTGTSSEIGESFKKLDQNMNRENKNNIKEQAKNDALSITENQSPKEALESLKFAQDQYVSTKRKSVVFYDKALTKELKNLAKS